ncbi:MAG: lipopolysaccharide biosynthesis protein [Sphingopyxis sp.]|nr:lipopolysaccharide biosynthesis protein [Sphingopyxis sp.]
MTAPNAHPSPDESMPLAHADDDRAGGGATDQAFGSKVKQAVFWRSGSQIVGQIITWSSTLIVIRLLDPTDYGLFAMSQVVIAFLTFLNGYGFASALVQSESVSDYRIRQAFGLLLVMNGGLAALQWLLAPIAADYYNQPIIADMLRIQTLLFLSTPFIALPEVLMGRKLDFKRQAIVNLTAALTGSITALTLAWNGFGLWTLVYAPILMFWVRAIGLSITARLLVWPSFDFRGCGSIIFFGSTILVTQLLWLIQTQSDIFFAGRQFVPHDVGLYSEALFLTAIITARFVPPLNDVAFPAYARLQSDPAAMRWSFLKAMRMIMLLVAPAYAGIAATANPLVATLFGAKWLEIAPLVTTIAIAMPAVTMQILFAPAMNALGRPDIPMRAAGIGAILFGLAFFIGSRFGVQHLAMAWLFAAPMLLYATIRLAGPLLTISVMDIARAVRAPVGAAIIMGAVVAGSDYGLISGMLQPWPIMHLAVLVALGVAVYAAMLALIDRDAIAEALRLVRRRQVN